MPEFYRLEVEKALQVALGNDYETITEHTVGFSARLAVACLQCFEDNRQDQYSALLREVKKASDNCTLRWR